MSLSEMLFIGLLGLVVFGPKKLVHVAQQAGEALAAFKKATGDFRTQLSAEILTAEQSSNKDDRSSESAAAKASIPGGNPGVRALSL